MVKNIKVAFYPNDGWHAYQQSMALALKPHGIEAYQGGSFDNETLLADKESDILHFHWIERLWDAEGIFTQLKLILGVYRYLKLAKKLGKKIVWTVHNHYPHDNPSLAHKLGLRLFAKMADAIYTHSEWSKSWLISHLSPVCTPVIVYHGNFKNVFTHKVNPEKKRHEILGNGEDELIGIVGMVRRNRGHDLAIKSIVNSNKNWKLLIAGRAPDPTYYKELQELAGNDSRITFEERRLTDQEYQELTMSCDALLLTYSDITTSGALLSAWTMGVPVVTTPLPFFKELIPTKSPAGHVMGIGDNQSELIKSIESILSVPKPQRIYEVAVLSDKYDWDSVILPMVASYKELLASSNK